MELRYETLLLDFHGTFTNSNKGRTAHALNEAFLMILGRNITRAEFTMVMNRNETDPRMERISVPSYLDHMLNGSLPEVKKDKLIKVYTHREREIYIPKHLHIIRQLCNLGANCVIVSNGTDRAIRPEIRRFGLSECISMIYARGKDGLLYNQRQKPHPQVLEYVMKDLKERGHSVNRQKTLMVGDFRHDIEAGSRVGIHTAFVITGDRQSPREYDHVPTYALLDRPGLRANPEWYERGPVYQMRDLPAIVAGKI